MVSVVIHTNQRLFNQVETAEWLREGFKRHGIEAEITGDKYKSADIHIVQGPWYCLKEWLGQDNVLFLNRCFFGHPRWDISLGWLRADGSRDFKNHGMTAPNGILPVLKPRKETRRCVVIFADYGESMDAELRMVIDRKEYDSIFFRPHPADKQTSPVMTLPGDLNAVWTIGDVALGRSSTVLVEAEIEGLHVICTDPLHVVHHEGSREQWLTDLSWANWNHEQLKRGDFWEHLC